MCEEISKELEEESVLMEKIFRKLNNECRQLLLEKAKELYNDTENRRGVPKD